MRARSRWAVVEDGSARTRSWTSRARAARSSAHAEGVRRKTASGSPHVIATVFEWVADSWNDSLPGVPADGTARMTGACTMRPLRGGSFYVKPVFARSAHRLKAARAVREVDNGFRVARPL